MISVKNMAFYDIFSVIHEEGCSNNKKQLCKLPQSYKNGVFFWEHTIRCQEYHFMCSCRGSYIASAGTVLYYNNLNPLILIRMLNQSSPKVLNGTQNTEIYLYKKNVLFVTFSG